MKKSIFKASFEESKRIIKPDVLIGNLKENNSMNWSLLNRLFTFFVAGSIMILGMAGLLFGMPLGIGEHPETIRYLSPASGRLMGALGQVFLLPNAVALSIIFLIFFFTALFPRSDLAKQRLIGLPFLAGLIYCTLIITTYLSSAIAFDRYGTAGLLLQVTVGLVLMVVILYQGWRRTKAVLYSEEYEPLLSAKRLLLIVGAISLFLLLLSGSVFQGLETDLNRHWYSYPLGLVQLLAFVVFGYGFWFITDFFLFQSYYLVKYSREYQSYLEIPDEEWYRNGRKKKRREERRQKKAAGSDKS
ncbi:hypothetical protein [Streptococcus pantholopis]|uniref:Beta-carotene 15,15'-monooxygenase n=1 Tax=Streptococcus pantholopis TaxID=1811193 RepID=A0A172Q5M7_9STRE|nr:hypothetical protein [Streptococcus pantholopis]AND78747.1 hypothetical protein A0O21_01225 [Streptococcus pantholopis]